MRQSMGIEDLREQREVTPGTLGLDEEGAHDFASGIVDGADQTHLRPPALEPVMGRTIDLEHHAFAGSSFPPTVVLDAAALLGRADPLTPKDNPHFLSAQLDLFLFLEFLGQMVIVKALVLSSG